MARLTAPRPPTRRCDEHAVPASLRCLPVHATRAQDAGHQGLAWQSVATPMLPPKDDLVALTGGYRGTPVLQIGADVYIDSQRIARELERRFPVPSLFPMPARASGMQVSSGPTPTSGRASTSRSRSTARAGRRSSGATDSSCFRTWTSSISISSMRRRSFGRAPASSTSSSPTGARFSAGLRPGCSTSTHGPFPGLRALTFRSSTSCLPISPASRPGRPGSRRWGRARA